MYLARRKKVSFPSSDRKSSFRLCLINAKRFVTESKDKVVQANVFQPVEGWNRFKSHVCTHEGIFCGNARSNVDENVCYCQLYEALRHR